jgi:hypothetical protein
VEVEDVVLLLLLVDEHAARPSESPASTMIDQGFFIATHHASSV